jgi:hypothetical protein
MELYLDMPRPLHISSKNLFCLRYDLHLGGFDQAQFVIVPKSGQLVVYFLNLKAISSRLSRRWISMKSCSTSRNQRVMTIVLHREQVVEKDKIQGHVNVNVSMETETEKKDMEKITGPIKRVHHWTRDTFVTIVTIKSSAYAYKRLR